MRSTRAIWLAIGVVLTTGAVAHPTSSGRTGHRVASLKITITATTPAGC